MTDIMQVPVARKNTRKQNCMLAAGNQLQTDWIKDILVVDQLVASGLQISSWTGFNPALVPNRTLPFRGNTCPGPAVEPDLFLPGRPLSRNHLPRASSLALRKIIQPRAPSFEKSPAPGQYRRRSWKNVQFPHIDMCLCYRHEIKHIRQVLTKLQHVCPQYSVTCQGRAYYCNNCAQ